MTPFTVNESNNTGYGAQQASSGRLGEAYIDTPQATSVVTSELMKDALLVSSFTALKFVPNVTEIGSGHSPGYNIRGITTGELYFDGFSIGSGSVVDSAFFDRIEVVKGPATAGYGRGNPAGFMNFVTKSPLFQDSTEIDTSYGFGGQTPNIRAVLDNNGMLSKDGNTAYRLVAAYSRGSTTKEGSGFNRAGTQLAVERLLDKGQLTSTTTFWHNQNPSIVGADLSNAYTYEKYLYSFYPPGHLPSHTLFPNADISDVPSDIGYLDEGIISTLRLNYNLSKEWSTRQAASYTDDLKDGTWSGPAAELYDPVTGFGRAYVFRNYSSARAITYQSDFAWKHDLEALKSNLTLLFGADISDSYSHNSFQVANSTATSLFPFNPGLATYSFPSEADRIGSVSSGTNSSEYVELNATFLDGKIRLTAAERKNEFDLTGRDYVTGTITSRNKASTPLFGTYSLLVKPAKTISLYATAAEYENPAALQNLYNGLPASDPRSNTLIVVQPITKLLEFGIKGSFLDDAISYTIAHFRSDVSGGVGYQILPDVIVNGVVVHASIGFKTTSVTDGWEFELFGRPSKHLTLMGGGGIESGTVTVPDYYLPQIDDLPQHPGDALFGRAKYTFGATANEGFEVDAGVKVYFSGWSYSTASTQYITGDLTYPKTESVVDFGMGYKFEHGKYRVGLDVTNAFNPHANVHTFGAQNTESGRLVFVSFDAKF